MRQNGLVTEVVYDNIADNNTFLAKIYAPFRLFGNHLSGNTTLTAAYKQLKNMRNGYELGDLSNRNYWVVNCRAFLDYKFSDRVGCTADLEYRPTYNTPHECVKSFVMIGCGIYWSPLNNGNLTINLDANNVLDTDKNRINYRYGEISRLDNLKTSSRYLKLGITYNFSSGKKQSHNTTSPIDTSRFGK